MYLCYVSIIFLDITSQILTFQKSHTCEEGGTHFRIPFWDLLMNLKNNYLFKKPLKWANRKQNNFNIYNVAFF